jgi:hypothetical protein
MPCCAVTTLSEIRSLLGADPKSFHLIIPMLPMVFVFCQVHGSHGIYETDESRGRSRGIAAFVLAGLIHEPIRQNLDGILHRDVDCGPGRLIHQ